MNQETEVTNNIVRGTIIIVLVGIIAKFVSFIAEAVLAAYLGTTMKSDAYYMVSSIQMVIYPMISVGIWKVFLPLYKSKIARKDYLAAEGLANKSITVFTMISITVFLILFIFSDAIVGIIAHGFSDENKQLCSKLVKISSPMYIFITAAAIYSSLLQSHNRFLGSQIREVASHIPTIIAAIVFYKKFGVEALAVALVVGGALRLAVELPYVNWGYKYRIDFNFRDSDLLTMFKRLPSALLSEGVNQINVLIDKIMASELPVGAVSSLNYGNKLTNVFSGLFSSAIATALYPQVVELVALDKKKELSSLIVKIIKIFALIMFPITIACFMFSTSLVKVVFERGVFSSDSVSLTSGIFSCYCLGLFFVGCNTVLTNVFYGYGDTRRPLYISCLNMTTNLIGNIMFISLWGVKGLALSTSTSAIIAFFVKLFLIKKYIILEYRAMIVCSLKVVIASLISCGLPWLVFSNLHFSAFFELVISAICGISVYLLLIKILNISEAKDLLILLSRKLGRK